MNSLKIEIKGSTLDIETEIGQLEGAVKIYSIDGKFIEELNCEQSVSLEHLAKGGYLIAIESEGKTYVKRYYR